MVCNYLLSCVKKSPKMVIELLNGITPSGNKFEVYDNAIKITFLSVENDFPDIKIVDSLSVPVWAIAKAMDLYHSDPEKCHS
jgi:hypothetical protein